MNGIDGIGSVSCVGCVCGDDDFGVLYAVGDIGGFCCFVVSVVMMIVD